MKIAIIGAGNVASHLADVLQAYADIVQIASRTAESSARLASLVKSSRGVEAITDLRRLRADCDLYLIAVNDDSIREVVDNTPDFRGIWAHTSGSVSMDVFAGKKSNYGVFYPLQTFSRDVPVTFSEIPMLIEGSSAMVREALIALAGKISATVRTVDSKTREAIHVAAVFACNFANLMWLEADRLLQPEGLDIKFMLPLLRATLSKLELKSPRDAMTGPARRGDIDVIKKHLNSLPDDLKPVYSLLTDKILDIYSLRKEHKSRL
jgi:predicted short-subunit dehydrogenase-like oxidoreductase (DUF2520 family)